jgi:hypothetical protein
MQGKKIKAYLTGVFIRIKKALRYGEAKVQGGRGKRRKGDGEMRID